MPQKTFSKNLSANAIQTIITQLVGLSVFYLMSRFISKEDFGEFQWTTAVGSTIIGISSLGLDLVLVKRIASGQDWKIVSGVHFFHSILIGLILTLSLLTVQFSFPNLLQYHPLFLVIFLQLLLSNIANSFKFSLTGLESFDSLALVAIVFNSIKLIVVTLLLFAKQFTIQNIVLGFIACSFLELLLSYYYLSKKGRSLHKPIFDLTHYKAFIYESLPQLGVVLFDSALARIDWILLGIYSTVSITAEYSFAYKFFELSKLPLLIIGPILLTRFSKLFTNNATLNVETKESIQTLFNLEMFISLLIPIFMVICWSSLIDFITDNKYGAINQSTFTILAFCIPIHFIINFYWTLGFAQGQLKEIMWITIFASILNLILNIIIIPKFGGIGAASAFLLSSIAQLVAYHIVIKTEKLSISLNKPILMGISAFSIVAIFRIVSFNVYLSAILACILYICFGIITKQFSIAKIKTILYSS